MIKNKGSTSDSHYWHEPIKTLMPGIKNPYKYNKEKKKQRKLRGDTLTI